MLSYRPKTERLIESEVLGVRSTEHNPSLPVLLEDFERKNTWRIPQIELSWLHDKRPAVEEAVG